MTELLPCPKCNEQPWTHETHNLNTTRVLIRCETEGCPDSFTAEAREESDAIAAWNAREVSR